MTRFRRALLSTTSPLAVAARMADGKLPPVLMDARPRPPAEAIVQDEAHHAPA